MHKLTLNYLPSGIGRIVIPSDGIKFTDIQEASDVDDNVKRIHESLHRSEEWNLCGYYCYMAATKDILDLDEFRRAV